MKVYALFENDYDAGSILKAVITRKDVAERFVAGRSHKYEGNKCEEIELDNYTEVAWALNGLEVDK